MEPLCRRRANQKCSLPNHTSCSNQELVPTSILRDQCQNSIVESSTVLPQKQCQLKNSTNNVRNHCRHNHMNNLAQHQHQAGTSQNQGSQLKKCTQVLAKIQRPQDAIYLTQDKKGKQMVVQRCNNVAKMQSRQRNESYNPFDFRCRGMQRPASVGVLGTTGNTLSRDEAMRLSRSRMQNEQNMRSDLHRPLQEEEAKQAAEKLRLKKLAENERKMKSYGVNMGHVLQSEVSTSIGSSHDVKSEIEAGHLEEESVTNEEQSNEIEETWLSAEERENKMNQGRVMAIRMQQECQLNDFIKDTTESRQLEAEQAAEKLRLKKLAENERRMKSYGINMGHVLQSKANTSSGSGYEMKSELEAEENVTNEEQSSDIEETSLSAEETEKRRNDWNRKKMLEARSKQQANFQNLLQSTENERKIAEENKAEKIRLKCLANNENKMKSYKVTLGYKMSDYFQDEATNSTDDLKAVSSGDKKPFEEGCLASSSATNDSSPPHSGSGLLRESDSASENSPRKDSNRNIEDKGKDSDAS